MARKGCGHVGLLCCPRYFAGKKSDGRLNFCRRRRSAGRLLRLSQGTPSEDTSRSTTDFIQASDGAPPHTAVFATRLRYAPLSLCLTVC